MEQIQCHNNHTGLHHCHPIAVLITPPPVIDTDFLPFNTTDRIKKYGDIVKKVAEQYQCPLIDFFSVLKYDAEEEFSTLFQQDGVHLSERGYDYLYDSIFSAITRIVDRNGILKEDNTKK